MNNIKKIGLTALAASLVSVSANAGSMSVAGGASLGLVGYSGEDLNAGKSFSMGNQLTFTGGGELDNGINVALSFVLDQGDGAPSPFDSHSLTLSNDAWGSLKFMGEGGSTTANAIDKSAAGDIWDAFDGMTNADAQTGKTATAGDNAMIYTSPELVDGLVATASYQPQGSNRVSGTGLGATYTGVEGLTVKYAVADIVGATIAASGDETVFYASYAYGPVTVSASNMESDISAANSDYEVTSYAISYTVSDDLSVTYGMEDITLEGSTTDAEYEKLSLSYTTGGMTLSASTNSAENASFTANSNEDYEKWTLGATFAF